MKVVVLSGSATFAWRRLCAPSNYYVFIVLFNPILLLFLRLRGAKDHLLPPVRLVFAYVHGVYDISWF
jgi:hypothetical protein